MQSLLGFGFLALYIKEISVVGIILLIIRQWITRKDATSFSPILLVFTIVALLGLMLVIGFHAALFHVAILILLMGILLINKYSITMHISQPTCTSLVLLYAMLNVIFAIL